MLPFDRKFPLTPLRSLIYAGVAAVHGAAIMAASLSLGGKTFEGGGAPIIQLTLEPLARFDGQNSASSQETSQASASQEKTPEATTNDQQLPSQQIEHSALQIRQMQNASPFLNYTFSSTDFSQDQSRNSTLAMTSSSAAASGGANTHASESGLTKGGGATALGAAAANQVDVYEATVLAWVERHKKHPGGNVGAVTVGFTLDRRGNLRASHIMAASGNPVLDHAAIDQLKEASPFPRPPADTEWRTRDFRVRIDFKRRRT